MTGTLKVRRIGHSLGFTVPRPLIDQLRVKEGDILYVVAEPDGGIRLTPYDPSFEAAVKAYQGTRARYRNALRQLAK
jgi:putative addiction module antidote